MYPTPHHTTHQPPNLIATVLLRRYISRTPRAPAPAKVALHRCSSPLPPLGGPESIVFTLHVFRFRDLVRVPITPQRTVLSAPVRWGRPEPKQQVGGAGRPWLLASLARRRVPRVLVRAHTAAVRGAPTWTSRARQVPGYCILILGLGSESGSGLFPRLEPPGLTPPPCCSLVPFLRGRGG